ncbi:MAG: molybdopterin-guanine dinucleotide biosynthesis protein B [Candidatus Melainabacteria bacterium HGW-Melainabacteria-1]|nr:MAG: molybdopterin-guanine dinucleotide biosynthesis protein B [Candidatus Melainabacteria bacterium HGW-Melainabacteria-1]
MNKHPYSLGVCGYSGAGKTTLIERLVPLLRQDYTVGYLKHDAHHFEMDRPGKDTARIHDSGAGRVAIGSSTAFALLGTGPLDPSTLAAHFSGCDLLLIEGYKQGPWAKLVVLDAETKILEQVRSGEISQILALTGPWPATEISGEIREALKGRPYIQRDDLAALLSLIQTQLQTPQTHLRQAVAYV